MWKDLKLLSKCCYQSKLTSFGIGSRIPKRQLWQSQQREEPLGWKEVGRHRSILWIIQCMAATLQPTMPTMNIGLLVTSEDKAPCSSLHRLGSRSRYWDTDLILFAWCVCWLWCGGCSSFKRPDSCLPFTPPHFRDWVCAVCTVSGKVSKWTFSLVMDSFDF